MKSAITSIGREFIVNNTTGGAWFSVTHFGLAWVNDAERTNNPATENATVLVLPPSDNSGTTNGDYIFNIWQTPFAWDATGSDYGIGETLPQGFGAYYKYEYDECNDRNQLIGYADPNIKSDGGVTIGAYIGATNSAKGEMTLANIPSPLFYCTSTATTCATKTYSKYFPIKSYFPVVTTDSSINAKVTIMDYVLELPAVTTQINDTVEAIIQSIGNFKFNRIGLYVTKSSYPDNIPNLITSLTPMADEEPVLFAIIDLTTSTTCGSTSSDTVLDIYKTRDDTGLAAWVFNAQTNLSSVSNVSNFAALASMYVDAARDDATNAYLNQIEFTANITESIMQLQLQYLQLQNYVKKYITGSAASTSLTKKGIDSIIMMAMNKEYFINDINNNVYYFKGDLFRSYSDNSSLNSANAIINISSIMDNLDDADEITIIIDNLDGTYLTIASESYQKWTGSITITNYDGSVKDKISLINGEFIKGFNNAKVTINLIYSYANTCWIVKGISITEEQNIIG